MAGGEGRRLGSLTTNADGLSTPKQYCSLNGGPSLLQLSLQRALGLVPRARIVPIVNEAHRRWWEPELFAMRRSSVVVQPSQRGTGLGILLALLCIAKSDPDAAVICLPSDHYVEDEAMLAESLRQAMTSEAFASNKLTLLGMSPNAPDSGFGYLSPYPDSGVGMRPVRSFVEKPDPASAVQLIRDGSVWSTGIFSGRISEILRLYARQVAGLMLDLTAIVEDWPNPRVPSAELASLYARQPSMDFSHDVLQKHPDRLQFLCVPPCGWNDVGTPARLAAALWSLRRRTRHGAATHLPVRAFSLAAAVERTSLSTKFVREAPPAMHRKDSHEAPREAPFISGTAWAAGCDEKYSHSD
ncbi:MAG TPA: sugar phosphate nucleotidyltransferase [Steroidobacteraceae bacterium]|nr:sugar phosphate nucleotidyltransferase [Steroidobacteraceae bacterium]